MSKVAFAIAAHPDDIEFLMAGTLILLKLQGYEIHYMNLANGCCGSTQTDRETTAAIRLEESQNACRLIGAHFHDPIANDLEIFYDLPSIQKLAATIRKVGPEIILTHAPVDYMEDHTATCRLAVTAAFTRSMPNFTVQPPQPTVDLPVTLYHAQAYGHHDPLRQLVMPEIFIDIASVHEQKTAMLAEHKSQKQWLDDSQGLDSYLTTQQELDQQAGNLSGKFELAEGWRRHLHLGFCEKEADPLFAALQQFASRNPEYFKS